MEDVEKARDRQGDAATDPVSDRVLFRCLSGPRQCQFRKLHMNEAVGLSEAAFGLGAGLFFIGYFLFEVPSTSFGAGWRASLIAAS